MLNVNIDEEKGIVTLEPDGKLSEDDFVSAAKIVDPYIETHGGLRGLIIYARSFPGWASFAALIAHLRFVKDHHRKVSRVALVTDSLIGEVVEHLGSHFVNAEVRHFDYDEVQPATHWILCKPR
ncbi:STAS/SEC14 domain-containing protein [Spongiibacter sp.]|uniref:STAS/SEC14 domain-containing protein n=1 Tax=Spongiibacter sp. TaxID=2024860 RepID=UPI003563088C